MQVWDNWKTNSGLVLHALQLRIFERGLQMLDVGGIIVYSTCSFNPLENEAVSSVSLLEWSLPEVAACSDFWPCATTKLEAKN